MSAARFDELIHAPTRLAIVSLLAASEWADFKFIRDSVGLSDSALSKQLTTLEEAGYAMAFVTGNTLLGVGGGLFGLGLIAVGIGALLVSKPETNIGGLIVFTAAGILGLGGIGCLIAGGIIRARA